MIYLPDNPLLWVLVFFTGAAIGSFLNVVIYRWPQRESVVSPPSHCMSCGARLGFIDLIPVLSYLILRGRCRHCRRGYSSRYALVELVTGLLLVGCIQSFSLSWYAAAIFVCCCCLLLVFFIDLDHMIIPDELPIVIALLGVGINIYQWAHFGAVGPEPAAATYAVRIVQQVGDVGRGVALPVSLIGIAVGGGAFLLVSAVFERFYGKPVLGFGDVKLAAGMGAVLGPGVLFAAWFLISVVIGAVVGLVLMALRVRGRQDYIPFGPMLAAGGVVLLLFPEVGALVVSLYGG